MADLIGSKIKNYEIISVMGKTGSGITYKAFDSKRERFVVLKMMKPVSKPTLKKYLKLKTDAYLQSKFSHPNIVTFYEMFKYESQFCLVNECFEGESIKKYISQKRKVDLKSGIDIFEQLLNGVGYIHLQDVIHGKIKPSNIFIDNAGVVKIKNFGIYKSLWDICEIDPDKNDPSEFYYMSPEVLKNNKPAVADDIFSIGCAIYEALSGFPPSFSTDQYKALQSQMYDKPKSISSFLSNVPVWLDNIILKSLEKEADKRFHSIKEILKEIEPHKRNENNDQQITLGYKIIRFFIIAILLLILIFTVLYVFKRFNIEL